jgi:hypothetical protein
LKHQQKTKKKEKKKTQLLSSSPIPGLSLPPQNAGKIHCTTRLFLFPISALVFLFSEQKKFFSSNKVQVKEWGSKKEKFETKVTQKSENML